MKELSIFIDESGDFGEYNRLSPYYIVSMVFHDQENSIRDSLESLEQELSYLDYPNHCLHAGPPLYGFCLSKANAAASISLGSILSKYSLCHLV